MKDYAKQARVGAIFVKDESGRFGLNAFKALGGSFAMAKFIAERKTGKIYAYYVEYTFDATKDYLLGDVNGDGQVTVVDATLIQKYIAGLVTLSDTQKAAADVNNDGSVSIVDVTQLQTYIAGLIDKF